MAPYPEEVDVFSAPHSRMKQLVDVYSEKLTCTDFKDYDAVTSLLHDLHHTFCEFKSHEQIENRYIMRKLKKRLKSLSIHDAAVCNCHSDNRLSDMLALVEDGYSCSSKAEADRINFGIKLQNALNEFTGSFLPHMKEEEEVFQPMLMKYFEYEELKCLKEQVLEEHSKWHFYDSGKEKHSFEKAESNFKSDPSVDNVDCKFSLLPPEIISHIFSFLSPQELLQCSAVNRLWYSVAHEPSLWREIYPCFWAHGIWETYDESHEDRIEKFYSESGSHHFHDEDADFDEYEGDASSSGDISYDQYSERNQKELKAFQCIIKYLLPQVGCGVQKIVISSSRTLDSRLLRSILILCPNVTHLDISYTAVMDIAFKGLKEYSACFNLQYLDMSGCKGITDLGLFRIADCMAMLSPRVPNASSELREVYLEDCRRYQNNVQPRANYSDCLCEIEESGSWLQQPNSCYQCRVNRFCTSVCFWKKNGVMCHLAKLSLQCPYELQNACNQLSSHVKNSFISSGASSVLKTTGTFVEDASQRKRCKPKNSDVKSLRHLNLSGCKEVTDEGLRCMHEAGVISRLEFLDVSGCYNLTGSGLCEITDNLKFLKPENLFYCDNITDGPYPENANGCQNLESDVRACCCRMSS